MLIELLRHGSEYSVKEVCLMVVMMLIALTLSFGFHEFMHAKVADWLGDDTPRLLGRVTLNPLAHLDPTGTVLLLLVGFGWGKPVMYNPNNLRRFKSKRLMRIMVSIAGVTGNFILSFVSMIIIAIVMRVTGFATSVPLINAPAYVYAGISGEGGVPFVPAIICYILYYIFSFSMSLMAFNLIPIPPLDGFHILEELLSYKITTSQGFKNYVQYGPMVLFGLIIIGNFTNVDILSTIMSIIQLPAHLIISIAVSWIGMV
ncbi:MAG: site-2 protease family protein [Saccharofermentans sp.]|nr:site-2 protease family protein [Saccharofermentans sp.]